MDGSFTLASTALSDKRRHLMCELRARASSCKAAWLMNVLAVTMLVGALQAGATDLERSASTIANATAYDLGFKGERVSACTVTKSSGNPDVDRYVCDAARMCGDKFHTDDKRDACMVRERVKLAKMIAKSLSRTPKAQ